MPEGVKLIDFKVTAEEKGLVEAVRKIDVDFARIYCVIYIQDSKLRRVEFEKVIESVKV